MMVKEALEKAERAQTAASKAIKQANNNIKGTQDLLTTVSIPECSSKPRQQLIPRILFKWLSMLERRIQMLQWGTPVH